MFGEDAPLSAYPWMVLLGYNSKEIVVIVVIVVVVGGGGGEELMKHRNMGYTDKKYCIRTNKREGERSE